MTLTDRANNVSDFFGNTVTITFRIFKQSVVRNFEFEYAGATATLNGEALEKLCFDKDGNYVVTTEQNGVTYRFMVKIDRTAPTLTLDGTMDGGETKSNVTLKDLSEEATIEIFLNGEKLNYQMGATLTELGDYRVVVTDVAGNVTEYSFTILYSLNGGAIALIAIGVSVLIGIAVAILLLRKKGKFGKAKPKKKEPIEPSGTESK